MKIMRFFNVRVEREQWMMLLAFFAWLLPQTTMATHVDDTWKYQVMLNGSNTIRISAPVYDMDGADCWVDNGNLKVTWTDDSGTHTETCFHWQRDGDTDNDNKDIWIHFRTDVGGSIDVTQGNSANHFTLTKADGDIQRLVYRNSDGKTFNVYAVWRVPYDLLGKDLKFSWDVHRDGNSRDAMNVPGLEDVPISMPPAQDIITPQVTMATLSYSESGKIEVPWFIASDKLTAARYEYTDQSGKKVTQSMPTNANSGTIYLDATVPHDNFRIVVSYKDKDDNAIENISSEVQNQPMVHAPVGLTAIPTGNSKAAVKLEWTILYPNTDDLTDADFFEVQRSLTGKEEDFVTIASEPFVVDPDNMIFEFTDSTLVEAIVKEQLKKGGTLDSLTYRVRRMISQNWGWEGNNCAQNTLCLVDDIHLLRIASYDAKWEDERAHTVRISWNYANERNAVWDNRAALKLRILMKNRAGEPVDSMLYTLTADERQQRYKLVAFTRPCVDYDIKLFVEQGASPINTWDGIEPYFFPIRTNADWVTFRDMVQEAKGQYDVNARLYADINAKYLIGPTQYLAFRGHFDGNGHTLNYDFWNPLDNIAPFRFARDYTIENLRVTGKIQGNIHCSGLVASSDASSGRRNIISNCQVSVTVQTDKTHIGGFIGHGHNASHTITNCLFDGTLRAGSGRYAGAFLGWEESGNSNSFFNNVENGSFEGFPNTNMSWTHIGSGLANVTGAFVNCYHLTEFLPKDETQAFVAPTVGEMMSSLGDGWQEKDGKVALRFTSYAEPPASYPTPTLPTFHYESIGKIDPTLKTETRQSSVLLVWETDGNPIDFFTVLRRPKGTDDSAWKEVETDIDQLSYEDKTVSPLEDYEYKVRATNDCEGVSFTETQVAQGACKHTGLLEGYVRFNDGTGVPDITVEVAPQGGGTSVSVKTDQSGYFKAEDLSYMGQQSVTYVVTPVSEGGIKLERDSYSVTFNNESNHRQVHEFTITNGLGFSAYVMYEGTSIPVKGAHFLVNGRQLHNAAGQPVETDFEGRADFQVMGGVRDTIQVVMPGHTFVNNGYYKSADGVVLDDKVAQTYFYDATLVKVTGRVVGGKDLGTLPLDNNLSRNNLGDDLTMVLTLEGDNTSWLVYDNQNPAKSSRQLTFDHPGGKGHKTIADVQRKRMVVRPDSVTGEYVLMLPPVRWKVQQVYCEGYPTLFQDGQVSEVIDLTESLTPDTVRYEGTFVSADGINVSQPEEIYNYRYDRIYHAPVEITYRQVGYDTFDYFGDKSYVAMTVGGDKVTVPLAYEAMTEYKEYFNPFDHYTHTPKLTPTDASHVKAGAESYKMMFDGNPNTKWCVVSNTSGWWVEFNTEAPCSLKSLNLTTGNDTEIYDGRNPKAMRLLGKANQDDEWTTLMETADSKMGAFNCQTYNFNVPNHTFCQYFRLEIISSTWGNIGTYEGYELQLSELSLTCRGEENNDPAEDHGPEPVMAGTADYTFGHPVFSLERKYPIEIQVGERYIYNNDERTGKVDMVKIGGGRVTVHNGLKDGVNQQFVDLDENGQGRFYLEAGQTTRLLTGENAVKTVTMTLTQDGTTYEAEPLKGYVLNMFATGNNKDVLVNGQPQLIDILRDPPGGSSTATLSKGSKLKYSYTLDMSLHSGLALSWASGTTLENYQGAVAAAGGIGHTNGIINSSNLEKVLEFEYAFDMQGHRGFAYTMNVTQDITTSSAATMVGAEADLYIGIVQNIIVTPMSTIRAIPDSIYQHMLGRLGGGTTAGITNKYGSLVHIAEGQDREGNKYHLVRDESIGYGPKIKSQFIHSQKYILGELIPAKVKELRELMFIGTAEEAQRQADATGKPVYRSLVPADSENFGLVNTKGDEIFYYTSTMQPVDSMNYVIHVPASVSDTPSDEVAEINQVIFSWVQMIAQNEREKLNATDFVANYDIDGGTKVTYAEQFESEYSISNYYHLPGIISGNYFDESGADASLVASSLFGIRIVSRIVKSLWGKINTSATASSSESSDNKNPAFSSKMAFFGKTFKFSILPTLNYSVKDVSGETKTFSRKESFNISIDTKSHLNIDLYRTMTDADYVKDVSQFDVFTEQNFNNMTDYVGGYLSRDNDMQNARYARGFVYRTRGGATCNPYEDERKTLFYDRGRILDERTKKICNPKITLDKQSVSGVAIGDPARFKVYLTNESEQPEAATGALTIFTFIQDMESNPKGAKIFIDGAPLTGTGMTVVLYPGKVMEKTMEVYAGEEFDYEGLKIGVASQGDFANTQNYVSFDVHYLHEAGPVLIAQPGDKWVMNTNAQYDDRRGWFLPVTINGFNKHQRNFDHIEFQYKESLRGEDSWTNLCSYYADSLLMAQASGVREMIPENGNITTHFYGEGTVMEKAYDLRAVLYCRNGNSFLTTASPIISGVKDTRRPQLFGAPEPKSGVLTLGDNIIFNFSEDIEHNYLSSITNFEVKGEVNNDNVTESVSLQFDGKASVETEARRNFSGKSLTVDLMVKPDETGRDMPVFSHGINGKKLQLWLTGDLKLKAVVDDNVYMSDTSIVKGAFTQVAMSINQKDSTLTFYNGGKQIGACTMVEPYNGTGTLIFGRTNENDPTESSYYEGRMMEARLWYRAMTGGQIGTTYGSKRLTGYEMGLVDYYPMNEGMGDYALDKTQGANATLKGASWAMPRGFSLRVGNDDKGIALTQDALNRTAEQDYTLMMWFKTDAEGRGVLVSNGAGRRDEINAENQFCLGFEAEKLLYKTHGMTVDVPGDWSDGQWHHLAMTVNRAFNVANIYVDQILRSTFAADSLGGISGGHPLIGAARYDKPNEENGVSTLDTRNWLTGNVDELCFFAQALPLTLIQSYATKSPNGDEVGLLTYLAFDRQERQKDNELEQVAYPYSKKLYLDDNGNVRYELDPITRQPTDTLVRDYVFVDSPEEIIARITNETAAPMVPNEELKNLNFNFVGKDNQLYVGINESNARLNRRNIYVTLRDVEDKNGNAMASPQTACYYVTNSSLQWMNNRYTQPVTYGHGESIYLLIANNSATSHMYTIENCPSWLKLDKYTDRIAPQDWVSVRGTVNPDLNVGTYDEILYLVDEEGVSEPLYLTVTVEANLPDWAWNVDSELLENSMNIIGRVYINDQIDIEPRDIVGAFDRNNVCHGYSRVDYSARTGESNVFLTVYDNQNQGRELYFKLWQYSTGLELTLTANDMQTITFKTDSIAGLNKPVIFKGGTSYVQMMNLKEGWNWVSFNVKNEQMENLDLLLGGLPWQEGDMLTELNGQATLLYENGHWLSSESTTGIRLTHKTAYAVKVAQDFQFPIAGELIKASDERTIWVGKGWNAIGYTPMLNLPLETALSDYYDKAEPGDVIKSHDQFAYFTVSGGVGRWRGNLEYMKPGEGYMMLRKGSSEVGFRYPFYEPGSIFIDEWNVSGSRAASPVRAKTTMTVSAVVEGFEMQEGDVLVAFTNGERVGETNMLNGSDVEDPEPLYLSIASDSQAPIWFAIERDGEIVATTDEQMVYKANAVIGSPDEPTKIDFVHADTATGKWYTIGGIQLPKRPTATGVYILNGKKVVIK